MFSTNTEKSKVSELLHELTLPIPQENEIVQSAAYSSNDSSAESKQNTDVLVPASAKQQGKRPDKCTHDDLLKLRHQLPPELCILNLERDTPYLHQCSLTIATQCPKATWLEEYYQEMQTAESTSNNPKQFVGISVGCNKGFDAIHTLRMGTYNDQIHKADWKVAMESKSGTLHQSVCGQDSASDMFVILPAFQKKSTTRPVGEMHCVEPMPKTFDSLEYSLQHLKYDKYGFHVTNAAISKESGTMYFPSNTDENSGVENQGLATCTEEHMSKEDREKTCRPVKVFSLKDFVDQKVKSKGPIHILSIDVEGFDCDVLYGAGKEVLQRVEYLEFEYNWMGSWAKVHLLDVVEMLDETGFTCYWAGIDILWRITDCWQSFYDIHAWSNVACVNRNTVPDLAIKMEEKFKSSLQKQKPKQWYWPGKTGDNGVHYPARPVIMMARAKHGKHELMSKDLDKMTQRYYARKETKKEKRVKGRKKK